MQLVATQAQQELLRQKVHQAGGKEKGEKRKRGEPRAHSWSTPDISLLNTGFGDAPPFPIHTLDEFWGRWAEKSARAANAPVDYTAGTLLATGRTATTGPSCRTPRSLRPRR